MQTKIPPPIVLAICLLTLFLLRDLWGEFHFALQALPSIVIISFGFFIAFASSRLFRKQGTTINPMNPETASVLVTKGMFRMTRNPMYLGMALVIIGTSVWLGSYFGGVIVASFVAYIHFFQILPEEQALQKSFGEDYEHYCGKVRRWF